MLASARLLPRYTARRPGLFQRAPWSNAPFPDSISSTVRACSGTAMRQPRRGWVSSRPAVRGRVRARTGSGEAPGWVLTEDPVADPPNQILDVAASGFRRGAFERRFAVKQLVRFSEPPAGGFAIAQHHVVDQRH